MTRTNRRGFALRTLLPLFPLLAGALPLVAAAQAFPSRTVTIVVLGGSPQVLADFMKADNQRYGSLARELNIKAD